MQNLSYITGRRFACFAAAMLMALGVAFLGLHPAPAFAAGNPQSAAGAVTQQASTPAVQAASVSAGTPSTTAFTTQATSYDIVYQLNGGTQANNQITSIKKGKSIRTAKLKTPTRANYRFLGWYSNRALTQRATTLRGVADSSKRTVYAKWERTSYSIVYSLNGGLFKGSYKKAVGINKAVKASNLARPTRTGYTFDGWYTDKKLKKAAKTLHGVADPSKRTVYAKWKPKTYVVSYELNGGAFPSSYATGYTASKGLSKLPTPKREGCSFVCWCANDKLTKAITSIPAESTGNKTLYAKWAERVMVAYHGSRATGALPNSLEAFKTAASKGFRYVSVDVRFTVDGVAVLATADGQVPVTPSDQAVAGGQQSEYVEFATFLDTCRTCRLTPYIELSEGTRQQIESLVSAVNSRGMATTARWVSSRTDLLGFVKSAQPKSRYVLRASEVDDDVVKSAQKLNTSGGNAIIEVKKSKANKKAMAICKKAGVPLGVRGLADEREIDNYAHFVCSFTLNGLYADDAPTLD